ncbi:MAG: hypothetical protein EXS00_00170 [Phycisphaerales bacterium]|nr:hypothetical protein [Phycisphaerales bacterium]
MRSNRRAYTLLEILVSSVITAMIGASVAGFATAFCEAVRLQDVRAGAILRTAGMQAHLSKLTLQSRMILVQDPKRLLLWLPSENLDESGSGAEAAFDRINLDQAELYWLDFVEEGDGSWSLLETIVDAGTLAPAETAAYFTDQPDYWSDLRLTLEAGGKLKTYPIAEGLGGMRASATGEIGLGPSFVYRDQTICANRHIGVEFAFVELRASGGVEDEEAMRVDMRIDAVLPFPDPHPICEDE